MGKLRRRYNQKGRQQVETVISNTEEKKIKLDIVDNEKPEAYDESNALVLPSKKRKTKKLVPVENRKKLLTKKMRRKLEKIVSKKEKKEKRSRLLEELMAVQASAAELAMLISNKKKKPKEKREPIVSCSQEIDSTKETKRENGVEEEDIKEESGKESESSICTSDISSGEEDVELEQDVGISTEFLKSLEKDPTNTKTVNGQKPTDKNIKRKISETGEPKKDENQNPIEDNKRKKTEDISNELNEGKENLEEGNEIKPKENIKSKPVVFIPVNRKPEMQKARLKLPILGEEQQVMEAINEHPVVIIVGDTGSGKTTQVPQFLYEAGYAHNGGIIGITEPRRVAAISMSKRVASEMNLSSKTVSFQIRYEGNTSPETKIKFMTDGVLFKEVQQDFLLSKYSAIILDEAHERTVYTDILIGLLSRIVPIRQKKCNPLKLIIMSATLRLQDFTENKSLFKITPPIVKVDSRQFSVTIHFNKWTPEQVNYIAELYKKACKIHTQLPEGGILIFVTSQQEVHTLCQYLKQRFPFKSMKAEGFPKPVFLHGKKSKHKKKQTKEHQKLPEISLDKYSVYPETKDVELGDGNEDDIDLSDGFEDDGMDDLEIVAEVGGGPVEPLYVLPMYSLLSGDKQARVFDPPPSNCRLCVVATNVAETSLTIPNIKYVIDCGKVKTKFCDKVTGASIFKVTWTSKASASQRAGRAGRVAPGHCYRLYSSAVYNDNFEEFSQPEIFRRPLDDIVLQMRFLGIDKVINFPFPTPPDKEQIKAAEKLLTCLGALTKPEIPKSFKETKKIQIGRLTNLGKSMAELPVSPRYAKMLVLAQQHGLMPYIVALVSALSVQELFLPMNKTLDMSEDKRKQQDFAANARTLWSGSSHSLLFGDPMLLLKAVGACEFDGDVESFCNKFYIRLKGMKEIRKLRLQLTNTINLAIPELNLCINPKMAPPTESHAKLLRQIVLAGMADHVARRLDDLPSDCSVEKKKQLKYAYETLESPDPVWIHPESVLFKKRPQYVVYQHIHETSKPFMKIVAAVEVDWFPLMLPELCQFSKPEESPGPKYNQKTGKMVCHMSGTFGIKAWPFLPAEVDYPKGVNCCKWFAKFLLEGEVCPKLKKFVPELNEPPCIMVKFWSKLKPQTEKLLKPLLAANVDDKESLLTEWSRNKTFLLPEYLKWLPEEQHAAIEKIWPPV